MMHLNPRGIFGLLPIQRCRWWDSNPQLQPCEANLLLLRLVGLRLLRLLPLRGVLCRLCALVLRSLIGKL